MNIEELKGIIKETVQSETGKITDDLTKTNKKYENIFLNMNSQKEEKGETVDPGIGMARLAKTLALANNDPDKALFIAKGSKENSKKGMYPNDKILHSKLKALSVNTPADGGFLVDEQYTDEMIPLLLSKTVVRELGARSVPMPGGNLNIPKLTGGATAYYQGENENATESQPTVGNIKLSSKKLTVLVPISNDLIKTSSPQADMIVRDDMIRQAGIKFDYTAMYGSGTEYTPMGIKTRVQASESANYSATTAVWTADDVGIMYSQLLTDNIPMSTPGIIFNAKTWLEYFNLKTTTNQYIYRDEMRQGRLFNMPFRISTQITTASSTSGATYYDMFMGDFSEFMIGEEMSFEIQASKEASYSDGSNLQSAFSLDQTVLKLTMKHDFGLRHNKSFIIYNRKHST